MISKAEIDQLEIRSLKISFAPGFLPQVRDRTIDAEIFNTSHFGVGTAESTRCATGMHLSGKLSSSFCRGSVKPKQNESAMSQLQLIAS